MLKILFVCTGNICRSPMAEGILRKKLLLKKIKSVKVSSAGIMAQNGNVATELAVRVSRDQAVDISEHKARMLDEKMIEKADMIFVMDSEQKEEILSKYPDADEKLSFLGKFHGNEDTEISDPYGLSIFQYRLCFIELNRAIEGLLGFLKKSNQICDSKSKQGGKNGQS